ncbi:MAG: sugar phosphate nucleotidyltransferase [Chlamydiota bacterium]
MQAVILAGGLGTRLRPVTLTVPKPMAPVLGRPFLCHQLEDLKRQGIRKALLLVGYLGEQVRDYFGEGGRIGMELDYSEERELLGTGGALKLAEGLITDDFFVIYGDSFLPLDYAAFEAAFRRAGTEGMIAVYRDPSGATRVQGNVALSPEGLVTRYDKGSASPELAWVEAGVLAFRRGMLQRIPPGRVVSLERDVYPELIREGALAGYRSAHRFFDIGTEERIRDMEAWLRQ